MDFGAAQRVPGTTGDDTFTLTSAIVGTQQNGSYYLESLNFNLLTGRDTFTGG